MEVKFIDHMGSDLSVVNSAKVSFAKESDWEYISNFIDPSNPSQEIVFSETLNDKDKKLINYLATHNHWTPFSHTALTFRVKAPFFVARQLFKHKVGLSENEISRRYVDDDPEFFWPEMWRGTPENKKQGSTGYIEDNSVVSEINHYVEGVYSAAFSAYKALIDLGVCPEQARMVLPTGCYTEWYWTGNLASFARVCALRDADDAQEETREIVREISGIIRGIFPVSWEALSNA